MKLYMLEMRDLDGSQGFAWFTSKRERAAAVAEFKRNHRDYEPEAVLETVEIPCRPKRKDIVRLLNFYADHPDNG